MPRYNRDEEYEREPLDSSYRGHHDSPSRPPVPPAHGHAEAGSSRYYDPTPYHNDEAQYADNTRGAEGYYGGATNGYEQDAHQYGRSSPQDAYYNSGGRHREPQAAAYRDPAVGNTITPGADNFGEQASGGMAGIAYSVADRNARESGVEAMRSAGQVPPPPSRTHNPKAYARQPYPPIATGGYQYESGYGYGQSPVGQSTRSNVLMAPPSAAASRSPSRSPQTQPYGERFADDPYGGYSNRSVPQNLGMVNPDEIADDGDDGVNYYSKRSSIPSTSNSERGHKGAGFVAGAAAVGAGSHGVLSKRANDGNAAAYESDQAVEKVPGWGNKEPPKRRRWKWLIILVVVLVIAAIVVGAVVGGLAGASSDNSSGSSSSQQPSSDLNATSDAIQDLMNDPNLHRVFPGMDYTPLNTQYPDCMHNKPSQDNVTQDVAVLSQLTNKIRLYGTDCNQTQMVIHALETLNLQDEIKIWMGVWQDKNETTNKRQLDQMWDILDEYKADPFEGIIVANEILFREEMTLSNLSTLLQDVRKELDEKNINLPVATSDLGDDWTQGLADSSDYIMANIHPFFSGTEASEAAAWTMNFWEQKNGPMFKSEDSRNIISETGWPTAGGKSCGEATSCTTGAVAGIDELNQFMSDWVCQALENGTNYFWFEAFDEPWKIRFNTDGKEWEDQWGLLDVNRKLKDGVKIPSCGGKTVG
jgi:exo-beta-1,3-glucanase (GH17 family)